MNELYKISHLDFTDAVCSWSVVTATSRKACSFTEYLVQVQATQGHCHTTTTVFFSYINTCTITKTRVEVLQLLHLYANRLCMHDLQKSSFVKSVRPQPREHIVALWHS